MSSHGEEMPALLTLADCNGNWDDYCNKVYELFRADFLETQPKYLGWWVRCRRDPIYDGKEAGFWHCVSEGREEDARTPDLRRCERIRWVRAGPGACRFQPVGRVVVKRPGDGDETFALVSRGVPCGRWLEGAETRRVPVLAACDRILHWTRAHKGETSAGARCVSTLKYIRRRPEGRRRYSFHQWWMS